MEEGRKNRYSTTSSERRKRNWKCVRDGVEDGETEREGEFGESERGSEGGIERECETEREKGWTKEEEKEWRSKRVKEWKRGGMWVNRDRHV